MRPNVVTKNEIDFILTPSWHIETYETVINRFPRGRDHRLVRAKTVKNTTQERIKLMKKKKHLLGKQTLEHKKGEYKRELEQNLWYGKILIHNSLDSIKTR